MNRRLIHHSVQRELRQRVALASAAHVGVSTDEPALLDLGYGAGMVWFRCADGEVYRPEGGRKRFPVFINSERMKGELVRNSDSCVQELHVPFA